MEALTHQEIEELLGAYALDAVEGDEARAVADHLVECSRCRAEVADDREVAALLAHGGADAPPAIWDRIAASIDGSGPAEQDTVLVPPALFSTPRAVANDRRASWWTRPVVPVAAAAAAVIGLLGFQVVEQGAKLDEQGEQIAAMADEDGLSRAFQNALSAPGAQLVDLRSADGEHEVNAVMAGDEGYVHAAALPELPEGRTYQLWADVGSARISLGVLGGRPEVASFAVHEGLLGLAITEEAGSGVVVSDQPPVVYGAMPSDA